MMTDGEMQGLKTVLTLLLIIVIAGGIVYVADKVTTAWNDPANSGLCASWTDMRDRQARAIKTCNAEPRCSVTPDDLVKLDGYEESVIRTCAGFER